MVWVETSPAFISIKTISESAAANGFLRDFGDECAAEFAAFFAVHQDAGHLPTKCLIFDDFFEFECFRSQLGFDHAVYVSLRFALFYSCAELFFYGACDFFQAWGVDSRRAVSGTIVLGFANDGGDFFFPGLIESQCARMGSVLDGFVVIFKYRRDFEIFAFDCIGRSCLNGGHPIARFFAVVDIVE